MLSTEIPLAIHQAIEHGACALLSDGAGWQVWTEPTPCPSCRAMRSLYIVQQGEDLKFRCGCFMCASEDQLMKSTAKMFEALP
jgi:hypothetical protein